MKAFLNLSIFLAAIVFCINANAQTYTSGKGTLAGVKGINVLVEALDAQTKADGLTESQLQTDAELRLRRAGIKVENNPLLPYLYININTLKSKDYLYAYSISVSFNQDVILERDKSITTTAETWNSGSVGIVGSNNLRQLREVTNDHVDKFINDYLAINATSSVRDLPPPPPPPTNKNQDDSPNFVARYVGGNRPPQVEVKNTADRILNLEFGGRKFVIQSGQSEIINTTDGGTFSFEATAPGVVPLKGQRLFERGYVYTWTFYIKTSR